MWLRRLEADRLRNLQAVDLPLAAGLTVVEGRNGQGKTSLLEAAYLLGTSRSFRTRRSEELVAWRGGPLRVAGEIHSRLGRTELAIVVDRPVRRLLVEGGEKDLESYLGRLDVVDLTAGRMQVLRGGPEERRRFLDRGIVGLQPGFLRALGEYRRALAQRNAFLRRRGRATGERLRELSAWDGHLIASAARVHRRRREYAVTLATRLGRSGRVFLPAAKELTVRYRPSPPEAAEREPAGFEELFGDVLVRERETDSTLGFTSRGPHRDELIVELAGADLRTYGSAGQLRSAMIALKLAKLDLLAEDRGESPVFLMDDFDADLDEPRLAAVAAFLHEGGFQAVVATSKENLARRLRLPSNRVQMEEGVARPG